MGFINLDLVSKVLTIVSALLSVSVLFVVFYIIKYMTSTDERIRINKRIIKYGNRAVHAIDKKNFLTLWGDRTAVFLSRSGANNMFKRKIKPSNYIIISITFGIAVGILVYSIIGPIAGITVGIAMCFIPRILLLASNNSDNNNMLRDINSIYDSLCAQTAAGMYLGSAIKECSLAVKHPRLKSALMEFSVNIDMSRMDMEEALDDFNGKFSNGYIDILTLVLKQSLKSGQASQYLSDLQSQMADVQHAIEMRKEAKTDAKLSAVEFLIYIVILVVSAISIGTEFMTSISGF